jgi:metal-responsive CopG/Arc/MetJ family transcriptional regulator
MKNVQMTLEEDLVAEVDRIVTQLRTTRSAFARRALRAAIEQVKEKELERKHREGYARNPIKPGEFSDWESEQIWGD